MGAIMGCKLNTLNPQKAINYKKNLSTQFVIVNSNRKTEL